MHTLNEEQQAALAAICAWLETSAEPYFLLSGYAGTGKTFLLSELGRLYGNQVVFSAPTNKATRILNERMRDAGVDTTCRTIFSLLGLRMLPNGEVKTLSSPDDDVDFSTVRAVVVDEGSMAGEELVAAIKLAQARNDVKFLFVGDPAQLPPVGEERSTIWRIKNKATLTKIMRFDNQILKLSAELRKCALDLDESVYIDNDHSDDEGVWRYCRSDWQNEITAYARQGVFSALGYAAKVIAWRNQRVDELNRLIRDTVFNPRGEFELPPFVFGDRIVFTTPVFESGDRKNIIATTDEEAIVHSVAVATSDFKHHALTVESMDTGNFLTVRVLHEEAEQEFQAAVEQLAAKARKGRATWKTFWEFKEQFQTVKHAYALTTHRSQGSTYGTAFVDSQDILRNPNAKEARQCLYVACTRASTRLIVT